MPQQQAATDSATPTTSPNPTGRRPRGPQHFSAENSANAFPGLPLGDSHYDLKDLVETAGPDLGWPESLIHHLRLLIDWTRPQDWLPGAQPIVWLSVAETAKRLHVSKSQVRRRERALHALGAISWKDSPNHRRFGARDRNENIVEAWGVNLAPAAALLPLLREAAAGDGADRAELRHVRHAVAGLRSAILAAVTTGLSGDALDAASAEAWRRVTLDTADGHDRADLHGLKRRLAKLELLDADLQRDLAGESAPTSPETQAADDAQIDHSEAEMLAREREDACQGTRPRLPPYDYSTKGPVSSSNTVAGGSRKGEPGSETRPPDPSPWGTGEPTVAGVPVWAFLEILPDSMRWRLPASGPVWPHIVDAAALVAADIGVSQHAWGEACQDLGREAAAIALTVVAVKNARGLIRSPGGYFRMMSRRGAAGALHLRPSVFGLLKEDGKASAGYGTADRGRAS